MSTEPPQFVFMTCRAGAEAALKQEVSRSDAEWRPAFSRPGFLTFKLPIEPKIDARKLAERHWTLAHSQGISFGRVTGSELSDLAAQVWQLEGVSSRAANNGLTDVHVWKGEQSPSDDQMEEGIDDPLCLEIESAIRASAPVSCGKVLRPPNSRRRSSPRNGDVLDIVLIQPGEWCVGYHRAVTLSQRWPGGAIPVRYPPHAVSRAYAKMDEAIQWAGLPLAPGDECVEIGCAPGGATQALLDRGLFVTGIDPAEVDPVVVAHPRFRHLKKRGKEVRRQEFIGVRWLAADMNVPPEATLDEVETIVTHPGVTIRGMVLTLKLSDWSLAARMPEFAQRVRSWGYRDVRARQLVSGGQEVCLVALRRKALRRLGQARGRKRTKHSKVRHDASHTTPPTPHF
jgi:23S rRNA (cytidine2498-2'-O)-methyltransferase